MRTMALLVVAFQKVIMSQILRYQFLVHINYELRDNFKTRIFVP